MIATHKVPEMYQTQQPVAQVDSETGYFTNIDDIRAAEYPSLTETTYLDHAGTTLYAKSLVEKFSKDLTQSLYGNPHSASASSQLSSHRIEDTRLQVLRFFNASPDDFEVVFTANATAAIKLVADAFRDHTFGFRYAYHLESHTSLIGVRELANSGGVCFTSEDELHLWLRNHSKDLEFADSELALVAYPGQSNMTGKRFAFDRSRIRLSLSHQPSRRVYTLLDAAALASTSPLDLSDLASAPDFIALSFYKIFGFPDLGALLVRKDSADVLRSRRYFGGGTVDSVGVIGEPWHAKRDAIAPRLEDGTLPFHNIIALQSALEVHRTLYGSMHNIARHTGYLMSELEARMRSLKHTNGRPISELYTSNRPDTAEGKRGAVLSFNLLNNRGGHVRAAEVEKLAIVNGIQFRVGGLCNPGGIASYLHLSGDDLRQNYAAGHRCGSENDLVNGKPTGTIRVSLGAMSSLQDVTSFISFLSEYYVDRSLPKHVGQPSLELPAAANHGRFVVDSLSVFPIKSCAAFRIPPRIAWEVGPKGLAWDREWCLVHEGTHVALSQKRNPLMALLFPSIDIDTNTLRVTHNIHGTGTGSLEVPLDEHALRSGQISTCDAVTSRTSSVCGETVDVEHYTSAKIAEFFTGALGVPCTLARFPKDGSIRRGQVRAPGRSNKQPWNPEGRPIHLSNESPILLVSRSSVNRLNEEIKQRGGAGKAVSADSFRGNIVIAEELQGGQLESPYAEDDWKEICIGSLQARYEIIGPCQRCQMVCVDQKDASKRKEPFSTLAKTRRRDGRVWFGMHTCLVSSIGLGDATARIQVGDRVVASY